MKYQVAVLVTVYNRKDVTIDGLNTLKVAFDPVSESYTFDIYMVDDGSTDGTGATVHTMFPEINVIDGNGSLFWGGGMLKAWKAAISSGKSYDYFLWYNDDSFLRPDAIKTIFDSAGDNVVVTGAFCDASGVVSYGGKDRNNKLIAPNGESQGVYFMNGNLVLISKKIVDQIGILDERLKHGGGDFEYGLRARKAGFKILLTSDYVGVANRHDEEIPKYCLSKYTLKQRLQFLKSPVYAPKIHFHYNVIAHGYIRACFNYMLCYVGTFFPSLYVFMKKITE